MIIQSFLSFNADGERKFNCQNKGGTIATVKSPDVTSSDRVAQLVKRAIALSNYIHIFKKTEKEKIRKWVSVGMFCIAPGCSNELYRVKDREKPMHLHHLPLTVNNHLFSNVGNDVGISADQTKCNITKLIFKTADLSNVLFL